MVHLHQDCLCCEGQLCSAGMAALPKEQYVLILLDLNVKNFDQNEP